MYQKDFDKRIAIKKATHYNPGFGEVFIKARQIRFAKLGCNIGFEEDGKGDEFLRPVLVVKKLGNTFFVVPLTTGGKENHHFYHTIKSIEFDKPSKLILNQAKTISKERFVSHIGTISVDEFKTIKNLLHNLYLED